VQIEVADQLDSLNEVVYLIADNPPPPFSRVVAQRDFVFLRHAEADRAKGQYCIVLRNGACPSRAPRVRCVHDWRLLFSCAFCVLSAVSRDARRLQEPYVRGEIVGVTGFVIRELPGVGCQVRHSSVVVVDVVVVVVVCARYVVILVYAGHTVYGDRSEGQYPTDGGELCVEAHADEVDGPLEAHGKRAVPWTPSKGHHSAHS
jgi:hypothetical protein